MRVWVCGRIDISFCIMMVMMVEFEVNGSFNGEILGGRGVMMICCVGC